MPRIDPALFASRTALDSGLPGFGELLCLQPEIEEIKPMVAGFSLLVHAEPMTAGAEDVHLRFMACRFQRLVKFYYLRQRGVVVLGPSEKHRRQLRRDCRHNSQRTSVDHRGEVRTQRGVRLK